MRVQHLRLKQTASEPLAEGATPFFMGPIWLAGTGAWERAGELLKTWPQPLGLVGEAGLLKRFRRPLCSAWLEQALALELLDRPDGSDCDSAALEALLAEARRRGVKALVGFGGGRMLDLAKLAGARLGLQVATVPSSPATCACATAVAVRNEDGAFAAVEDVPPPVLCVVETAVLAEAPKRLLAAGMADALAKWLEWQAVDPSPQGFGAGAGWALAREAAAILRSLGTEALAKPGGAAFEVCLEACLLWPALASNIGRAPAAAAHSLANALSRQAAGRSLLHGEAVGLGLLWQERLLNGRGAGTMEAGSLAELLGSWGLPTTLPAGLDERRLLADAGRPGETLHLLDLDPALMADPGRLPT